MTNQEFKSLLRVSVRTLYDMQKLRIQVGNRLCAAFRDKLGLDTQEAEEENPKAKAALDMLRKEHDRITDGVINVTKRTKLDSNIITDYGEYQLISAYVKQLEVEESHYKHVEFLLEDNIVYQQVFKPIKGLGVLMSAVLLSEIDIDRCHTFSVMCKYCGLDVVVTENEKGEIVGEARSKKRHHLVPRKYKNASGEITETVGITFNDFVKSKMLAVMGGCLMKAKGEHYQTYLNYKNRLINNPKHKDKSKAHINNMAKRYMVKIMLEFDVYYPWRKVLGLPIRKPYVEEKLGIKHSTVNMAA